MEDVLVLKDKEGGTAVLTTNSPVSHYGVPVLRIEAADIEGDFGPSDLLGSPERGLRIPRLSAAEVVAAWAIQPERSPEEVEAARKYLAQWPEGPQVEVTP